MIFSSFHLIIKRYHQPWHSPSLFHRRFFLTNKISKHDELLLHYSHSTNPMENVKFYRKGTTNESEEKFRKEKTKKNIFSAKETVYSLVIVTGVVALGGLTYLILHELYSRETPKGIFKEASKLCLADQRVSWWRKLDRSIDHLFHRFKKRWECQLLFTKVHKKNQCQWKMFGKNFQRKRKFNKRTNFFKSKNVRWKRTSKYDVGILFNRSRTFECRWS